MSEYPMKSLQKYAGDEDPWRIVGVGHQIRCVLCGTWCDAHTHIQDYALEATPEQSTVDVQALLSLCAHDHECPSALQLLEQIAQSEGVETSDG